MGDPIRLLIVDDHAVVRQGLRMLLTQRYGIEVVGEAGDGAAAVDLAAQLRPGRHPNGPGNAGHGRPCGHCRHSRQ